VQWIGQQAVIALPEHIDACNAGQIHDQLLTLVSRGAAVMIADMTATVSCDHTGADALVSAYQRALVNGAQVRLVVIAHIIRRVLEAGGLDRLIPIYPTTEAAAAAGLPAAVIPLAPRPSGAHGDSQVSPHPGAAVPDQRPAGQPPDPGTAVITPVLLWKLVDALADGVVLTGDGGVLVLANRQAEEMFGYGRAELVGRPMESLIPTRLQIAHLRHRAGDAQQPNVRPMGTGARLVGRRKDGATLPVEISLSPVPTATGRFTLAVIRNLAETRQREDLVGLARATVAATQGPHGGELLNRLVGNLFEVGLSLQIAIELPHDIAGKRITEALQRLDDTIREIRDHAFGGPDQADPSVQHR
jgi:anti-anti-sigma factor